MPVRADTKLNPLIVWFFLTFFVVHWIKNWCTDELFQLECNNVEIQTVDSPTSEDSNIKWLDRLKSVLGNYNYIINIWGRCENFLSDYGNMISAENFNSAIILAQCIFMNVY